MRLIDADALIDRIESDIKAIEDIEPQMAMGAIGVLNTIKKAPTASAVVRCKDCKNRHRSKRCAGRRPDWFCADGVKQVTGKLNNPDDSLLTEDSEACKEQESKLDLIRREDAIDAIDDAIDADSPQWAILRTKIGFLPSADRPKGKWVRIEGYEHDAPIFRDTRICPECRFKTLNDWNFCPNCGADCRGDKE